MSFDYLALSPSPFEEDEDRKKEGIERLVTFYEKFNFKIVSDEEKSQIIMGRNLNHLP